MFSKYTFVIYFSLLLVLWVTSDVDGADKDKVTKADAKTKPAAKAGKSGGKAQTLSAAVGGIGGMKTTVRRNRTAFRHFKFQSTVSRNSLFLRILG